MMVNLDLNLPRPKRPIFSPSMKIEPWAASTILNKDKVNEDLPAPVLPTIPNL
jgi:hypothetical protein